MLPPFGYILLAAFFNALAWIILIPVWQYPDEQAHFAQVQFIAEQGGIPQNNTTFDTSYEVAIAEKVLGTERDENGNNKFTYHPEYKLDYSQSLYGQQEKTIIEFPNSSRSQMVKNEATLNPPLYYNLGSVVYKIFSFGSLFERVYAVRFLSLIFFLGTVFTAFKIGQLIFVKSNILPLALAGMIAFKPMLSFASTGVLPDSLTILLFSIFIYLCLRMVKEGISSKNLALVLITITLGAMTRQHFLISLFILPMIFLYHFIYNSKQRKKIVISTIAGAMVLFIASYFVPALDFIRRFDYPESSRKILNNPLADLTYLEHLKWTIRHSIAEVWPWFWGVYKWLSLTVPHVVYQIINRLVPIALIGVLIKIYLIAKKREFKKEFPFFFLILVPIIYFMALTTFDYFYRKNNGFSFGIQGRYFFPTIASSMAILLVGFWTFFQIFLRRFSAWAVFIIVILFLVFNLISLTSVSCSYYDCSSFTLFINQASQYKPVIFKGNILYLIFSLALIFQAIFVFKFYRLCKRGGNL